MRAVFPVDGSRALTLTRCFCSSLRIFLKSPSLAAETSRWSPWPPPALMGAGTTGATTGVGSGQRDEPLQQGTLPSVTAAADVVGPLMAAMACHALPLWGPCFWGQQ